MSDTSGHQGEVDLLCNLRHDKMTGVSQLQCTAHSYQPGAGWGVIPLLLFQGYQQESLQGYLCGIYLSFKSSILRIQGIPQLEVALNNTEFNCPQVFVSHQTMQPEIIEIQKLNFASKAFCCIGTVLFTLCRQQARTC